MTQSFSNPLVEQREFVSGASAVLIEDKAVLLVSGEDRLTWLNDLLSQKLDDLKPGVSVEALWLDAQGRIVRDFHIVDDGENTWMITYSEDIDTLLSQLQRMVFRAKVAIENRTADYAVIATWSKAISGSAILWSDPWPETVVGGWRYGENPTEPWQYLESLVPAHQLDSVWKDFKHCGTMALDALRVAARRPTGPNEIDDKALPHEFDWLSSAVHMNKGCYRGQEAVAKVHNLGHPPRRLVFLHLDGSAHSLPDLGDEVLGQDGVAVGKITSAGQHHEMGPIALALVKRNTPIDMELKIVTKVTGEELSATQEVIVPVDAGSVVDVSGLRGKK
ncbi:MAG: YgfZ/GcvT domain-containing protein [Rhodoluna sp.]